MIVGLMGGGQLGRMLALAGYPLGLRFRTFDLNPESPAGYLTQFFQGDFSDREALLRFSEGLDLVTYEFENVPVESVRFLSERLPVYPPPEALEASQDRFAEKSFFESHGIPTASFLPVSTEPELIAACDGLGFPSVLKTRRFGYDGKGQFVLRSRDEALAAWHAIRPATALIEEFVRFDREVSVLAVRGTTGETRFYPPVENVHRDGILRRSVAPAPDVDESVDGQGRRYAGRVLEALNYVGVIAIEFFEVEGRLLANEMAPRVHNSGHWTIEGARTSQFENHLRAVLGLPPGSTAMAGFWGMLNLIGRLPALEPLLREPGLHLHLYDKSPRAGRKLGHVTLQDDDLDSLKERLARIESLLQSTA